jgi:hypothetical protein
MAEKRATFVGLVAVALLAPLAGSAEEAVTFRYAPPADTGYELVVRQTRTVEFEGVGRQKSRIDSRSAVTIARVAGGYTVTTRSLDVRMQRDGRQVNDPVLAALQDVATVLRVASDGRLLSVEGYDGLEARLRARFPAEVVDQLAPALSPEALVAQERSEWQGRFGALLGRTVEPGEVLRGETTVQVAGQPLLCDVETRIIQRVACGERRCVRLASVYQDRASAGAGDADPATSVRGESERVLDPETMLIFQESMSRTSRVLLELPGQGPVRATTEERREYLYEYR